jgi:UV DNA damage endonuclease
MTNIQLQKINAPQQTSTAPYLGLVCITSDQQVRFRTITRTRYLKLSLQQREDTLRELYQHNLRCLDGALTFCQKQNIRLYHYQVPWIEVEAKHKEKAIAHLHSWWVMQNNQK